MGCQINVFADFFLELTHSRYFDIHMRELCQVKAIQTRLSLGGLFLWSRLCDW